MATKKTTELQNFSLEELQNELQETVSQYHKMKYDQKVKGLDNPLAIRSVRRDIARMKTELRGRDLQNVDLSSRSKIRARRRK